MACGVRVGNRVTKVTDQSKVEIWMVFLPDALVRVQLVTKGYPFS